MKAIQAFALFIGRTLLASIFVFSAVDQMMHWDTNAQMMASKGMTLIPMWLLIAIFLELIGGLSLFFGYNTRIGAIALILLLVASTVIFESFWAAPETERDALLMGFMRNASLLGGLIYVLAVGPGGFSIDCCRACRKARLEQMPQSGAPMQQPPQQR